MSDAICLPCDEQECDTCHNLLWAAGCQCPHTTWPASLCGVVASDGHFNPYDPTAPCGADLVREAA